MKKIKVLLTFIMLFPFSSLLAAAYIGIQNGEISKEFISYSNSGGEDADLINGNVFGLEVGYFLTNSVAVELGYSDVKFKQQDIDGSSFTYKSDINGSFINYGFRWYLVEYFNIRLGVNRSSLKYNAEVSGSLTEKKEDEIDSVQYYGFGFGVTFNKMQIFYDWVTYPNKDGENGSSQTVGLKLFF